MLELARRFVEMVAGVAESKNFVPVPDYTTDEHGRTVLVSRGVGTERPQTERQKEYWANKRKKAAAVEAAKRKAAEIGVLEKPCVYLIRQNDEWKIGMTTKMRMRIGGLVAQTNRPIELITAQAVSNPRKVESKLHRHFADKNLHGEWFALKWEDADAFCDLAKAFDKR